MEYQLMDMVKFFPGELRKAKGIGRIISIAFSFLAYIKIADKILIPGLEIEKLNDDLVHIQVSINFDDLLKVLEEKKIKSVIR